MLLSLLCRLVQCLLGSFAVLVRSDLSTDVELLVLRQENQVLRRQAGGRPRRITPAGSGSRRCRGW
jgi:putative transposase